MRNSGLAALIPERPPSIWKSELDPSAAERQLRNCLRNRIVASLNKAVHDGQRWNVDVHDLGELNDSS